MTHGKLRTVLSLFILVAMGGMLYLWLSRSEPVLVIVEPLTHGVVEDTVANTRAGTIRACRRAGISPRVGGQIDLMPVKEGDKVAAGQVLMEFWNDDLSAQVKLAASEYDAAGARAEQTCVLARVAEGESRRQQQLKMKKLTAEEAVDKADGEARAQRAACAAAHASVKVSQAKLEVARAALDQTRLKAPFAGVVAEVNGEIGEFVTPSPVGIPTPPAVDLIDVSCLYVSAPIDEVDAPGIKIGMPARIALDAFPGQTFQGRVRRIAPYVLELEKQARTVDVEVDFDLPEECGCMLPGYSADIEIILDERAGVLRVPTEAVVEGNKVYHLTAAGRLVARSVTTGLSNWSWTEIIAGLDRGDEIVISVDRAGVEDGALATAEKTTGDD